MRIREKEQVKHSREDFNAYVYMGEIKKVHFDMLISIKLEVCIWGNKLKTIVRWINSLLKQLCIR